ncbi:alpha/beta hydrolase [Actinoplanes teichomyceticus]|uniref:Acetyl esterase n=1 Tax=Actinoplanes teichomyceticus TaxID=1867 RepID=A0A561WME4_ACTTI|nr:alpha/beta hydrolase [Actinoplanes teichomyceticus]TWG25046.1 acetyl esterase [Actinoplanes teichomyceticus]GIF10116.1 esterase [Actinoplanes teichomyceticus]
MSYPKPVLEPAAERFVRDAALPPYLHELGVEQGRKTVAAAQSGDGVPLPAAQIEDVEITGGPSGRVRIRLVRPPGPAGVLPATLYAHGGGWVFGDPGTHERLVRELAVRSGSALVFVDYSRSPEARYPIAIEEIYTALEWVAVHGAGHRLDPCRIAVAGDGAGGNLAAAVSIMVKQRSGPTLAGQVLFYPVTDATFDTDSYHQFAEGHGLRRDTMPWFWDQYAPDVPARAEITASPLRATTEQLAGLPPALVIVAEADVLRDEGEAYAARLRAAGVPVTAVRYQGAVHDFVTLDALRDTYAARAATAQAAAFLRDALR